MAELTQDRAMVVVADDAPKGGVTTGGAIRHAGERFPASVLPASYFALVRDGLVQHLSLEAGVPGTERMQVPPIAVARNDSGELVYVPGDRKSFRGVAEESKVRE